MVEPVNDSEPFVNEIPPEVEEENEQKKKRDIGASAPDPKDELLKKKQKLFADSLVPHVQEFGKDMIRAFYDYWSEPNKSRTRIKYEMESTWDLKKRLERWRRNDDKYQRGVKTENGNGKSEINEKIKAAGRSTANS